ncbi:MAG: type II secretion system F family protein [Mariprofundaceae bacterium]|nr:type II secretion system F family protein [Mariprofundaceae bacterium]
MSLFAWKALDVKGRQKRGELEAESERTARKTLKEQGLVLQHLEAIQNKDNDQHGRQKQTLNSDETTLFLQQLSTLTSAGMALTDALEAVATCMENKRARRAVSFVRQQVLEGSNLADALRHIGMDDVVCNMVAAGEETGQLEAVASRLSDLLEKRQQMSQDLLSAVLYPSIILGFGFLVMAILLTWVVPQIVSVFEHSGGQLPMLTQVVLSISAFLRNYGLMLILSSAGFIFLSIIALRNAKVRFRRDQFLLRAPLLSSLFKKIEIARFSRTLGMLLSGGVSTLSAMVIAKQSFMLMPMKEMGEQARECLREGGNLSDILRQHQMPHLAVQLIAVGEQSGQLDSMLIRVANQYEQEISRNLKRILTVVEPALMLVMAIMVGLMAVAILLPIVEMNSLVR